MLKQITGLTLILVLSMLLSACSGDEADDGEAADTSTQDLGYQDTASQDAASEDTTSDDTGAEDTGATDTSNEDTGHEDTGVEDTGVTDTSGEDTSAEDMSDDASDDGGTDTGPDASPDPGYCSGTPSCRGIELRPSQVPGTCNNTPGCTWDASAEECQGTPEFTFCAGVTDPAACASYGCDSDTSDGQFSCTQPSQNPPIPCEVFADSPNRRTACQQYGCTYDGPTTGTCSAPMPEYVPDCSSARVDESCNSATPGCCEYYDSCLRGEAQDPDGTSYCQGQPTFRCRELEATASECESYDACYIRQGSDGNDPFCYGGDAVKRCEAFTGELSGHEGQFSYDCEAFGCNWEWDSTN